MFLKPKITRIERIKRAYKKTNSEIYEAIYAFLLAKEGFIREAMSVLKRDNFYGLFVYAGLLIIEGKKDEAIIVLEELLNFNPFYLNVRKTLAKLLLDLGKMDEAKRHFEFVLLFFEDPESKGKLDIVCSESEVEVLEEVDEASVEDDKVIILDDEVEEIIEDLEAEDEEFLTVELVKSLMEQCLFDEAMQKLEKILEKDPENEEAHRLLEKLNYYLEFLEPEEPKE